MLLLLGYPDSLRGEEVVAFIVPVEGVTVSEVESDVHRAIPHEAQPNIYDILMPYH